MEKKYVEKRGGGYYVAGTRVSLDSVVYSFREGTSPEFIRQSFPVLTLEEVYGAIAFYLHNQKKIDRYLEESERQYEIARKKNHEELKKSAPELYQKLRRARAQIR
ncbi:MAG: DUF433 domain-containing protein [Pyrinomonadaceae bacterium]